MADKQVSYPTTVPLPPLSRAAEVAELLVGAIDLHCHSGPAAKQRLLHYTSERRDAAHSRSSRGAARCGGREIPRRALQGPLLCRHAARDPAGETVPRNQCKT